MRLFQNRNRTTPLLDRVAAVQSAALPKAPDPKDEVINRMQAEITNLRYEVDWWRLHAGK